MKNNMDLNLNKFKKIMIAMGVIVLLMIGSSGCSSNPATVPPVAAVPQVVSIGGGSITIPATDAPVLLQSQSILDSNDNPVVDGTKFVVTGTPDVQVSVDGVTFSNSITVASVNAIIQFSVSVSTQAGVYPVQVVQAAKQVNNANGFFYITVQPNVAYNLGSIISSRFEDQAPWTGVYQVGDLFSALADGQTAVQLTVGPILDTYGNVLQTGLVRLVSDKGQTISENPTTISDGYVYFSYLPTTTVGPVNLIAQAIDETQNVIIKELNGVIYQVKPVLAISTPSQLGSASNNVPTQFPVVVQNVGTTDVTNLALKTAQPFSLPIAGECPKTLHAGQSCQVTLQILTPSTGTISGTLTVTGLPNTIPDTTLNYPISVTVTAPASLALSVGSLSFSPVSCGTSVTQDLYVINNGQTAAPGFSITNPPALNANLENTCNTYLNQTTCSAAIGCRWFISPDGSTPNFCTSRPFDVVTLPADANPSADPNAIINCGSTIPPARFCRIEVIENPEALFQQQSVTARVQATGISFLPLTISGSAVVGAPAGKFNVSFNPASLNLSTKTTVAIGPVTDICGDTVANNTPFTASVTSGSLSAASGSLLNGSSTLVWTGPTAVADLGNQSIQVQSGSVTINQSINFVGSNLSVTGPNSLGEIALQTPQNYVWTVVNNGNSTENTITYAFNNLSGVQFSNVISTCSSLPQSGTCTITATATPVLGTNQTTTISGELDISGIGYGQTTSSIQFTGFGHQSLTLVSGTIAYFLGNQQAGVPLSRTITLLNSTANPISGLNLSWSGSSTGWTSNMGTCAAILPANSSCNITITYSNIVAGIKTAALLVNNASFTTQIALSLNLTANEPAVISAIALQQSSIPADGQSTDSVTIGPIYDLYGNVVLPGTLVNVSINQGSIEEAQPLSTDINGNVVATVLSASNAVGKATIQVQAMTSTGTVGVTSFQTITYSGVDLVLSSNLLDFGSVAMGQTQDVPVTLTNLGNTLATGLSILAQDSSVFSVTQLNTCSSGQLAAGASCDLVVRFSAPVTSNKAQVLGTLTVTSSVTTGVNQAVANLTAENILPATLIADVSTVSVQLIPGQSYTTTVTLDNIGNAPVNNFLITSNNPNVILASYGDCDGLAGGASCTFTLNFTGVNISSALNAIITATADNTSVNINFTTDFVHLAFINPSFNAPVFSCQPVQIQAQDSNLNPMIVQNTQTVSLTSSRQGSFYTSHVCSGATVAQLSIYQDDSTSSIIYFEPKGAGKQTLTATEPLASATQDNLANLVVSPGSNITAPPMQPEPFQAAGAVAPITCVFIANNTGSQSFPASCAPITTSTSCLSAGCSWSGTACTGTPTPSCNYTAGPKGQQTDQILLQDSDNPPNTASIQVTTSAQLTISPGTATINSGGQVQFQTTNGSGTGYIYSITPSPNGKIGSSVYNNLYTAGQNTTGATATELVTVTDSLQATASATITVNQSVFQQIGPKGVIPPTFGQKSVAVWKNLMVVGDPGATAATTPTNAIVNAGLVHIYQLITPTNSSGVATGPGNWKYISSINAGGCVVTSPAVTNPILPNEYCSAPNGSPPANHPYNLGAFGTSVGIFNNQVVVGAPGEPFDGNNYYGSGAAYYFQLDSNANLVPSSFQRINARNSSNPPTTENIPPTDQYGFIVGISGRYLAIAGQVSGIQVLATNDLTQQVRLVNPVDAGSSDPISSMSLYSDLNYGGTYVAVGTATTSGTSSSGATLNNFGQVLVYKMIDNGVDPTSPTNELTPLAWDTNGVDCSTTTITPNFCVTSPYDPTQLVVDPTLVEPAILPPIVETDFASNFSFGAAVSMYGPYLAVGAPGADNGKGRVYIYKRDPNYANGSSNNVWGTEKIIAASTYNPQVNALISTTDTNGVVTVNQDGAGFGATLSQFGNYLLAGAPTEQNYPGLTDSGSVYVFQRYLSDDNSWEFLGEIKSSDYTTGDKFGTSIAAYTNNFVVSDMRTASGNLYYFTGGLAPNVWPFGFHGTFNLGSGIPQYADYHQPAGYMRDWSSFFLPQSSNYFIDGTQAAWSTIGVANDMQVNGRIVGKELPAALAMPAGFATVSITGNKPDESGYNLGTGLSYQYVQPQGGNGGNPGLGVSLFYASGAGGDHPVWYDTHLGVNEANGAETGYPSFYSLNQSYIAGATAGIDGSGGLGGNGGDAYFDGQTRMNEWDNGAGCNRSDDCEADVGDACAGAEDPANPGQPLVAHTDNGGGIPGTPGNYGELIYIKSNNIYVGVNGVVDVSGSPGVAGQDGQPSNMTTFSGFENKDDFCGCLGDDNCGDQTNDTITSWSGGNGGGGGGAGGNAGFVAVDSVSNNISSQFFAPAFQSAPGGSGGNGYEPTWTAMSGGNNNSYTAGNMPQATGSPGVVGNGGNPGGACWSPSANSACPF
jgi:hypothetical protein